jgi:hypothetical protein
MRGRIALLDARIRRGIQWQAVEHNALGTMLDQVEIIVRPGQDGGRVRVPSKETLCKSGTEPVPRTAPSA